MNKLIFSFLLALNMAPAFAADYLIQYPGNYTCATEKRTNAKQAPTPGVDCEAGSTWAPLVWVNGDADWHHYLVNSDHTLTYFIPALPVQVASGDPIKVRKALDSDKSISASGHDVLNSIGWIFDDYDKDSEAVQAKWSDLKASGKVSPDDALEVETVCGQLSMPLVQAK